VVEGGRSDPKRMVTKTLLSLLRDNSGTHNPSPDATNDVDVDTSDGTHRPHGPMSVLLETSKGDIVIDLLVKVAATSCENFLKLCKIKYYNFCPISSVERDYVLQTGDPLFPTGNGGSSVWGQIDPSKPFFTADMSDLMNHDTIGTVSMVMDPKAKESGSQFIITLSNNLQRLDDRAAPFGRVVEGLNTLERINTAICDSHHRPLQDIRIKHTIILDDPFEDPPGLEIPGRSPSPSKEQLANVRIAQDEELEEHGDEEELDRRRREREAKAQALTLEMVGDLPFADVKPLENVLFVCKLNPVTQDEDLRLIFSRFGTILSCEVIRDHQTGDSLQYAFIEFENQEDCEQAYSKMQGVLIDDHRIHVDFSQSVSKLSKSWQSNANQNRSSHRSRLKMDDRRPKHGGDDGRWRSRSRSPYRRDGRDRDNQHREYSYEFEHSKERHSKRDRHRGDYERKPSAMSRNGRRW